MPMLVIFTNIISHPIARDRLINLRNVGTDETSSIPLAIQTRIANQYRLKCQTRIANQCPLKCRYQ
jgi:hypothetical protein